MTTNMSRSTLTFIGSAGKEEGWQIDHSGQSILDLSLLGFHLRHQHYPPRFTIRVKAVTRYLQEDSVFTVLSSIRDHKRETIILEYHNQYKCPAIHSLGLAMC